LRATSSSRSQKDILKNLIVKKKTTDNQASALKETNTGVKTETQTKDMVPAAVPAPPASGLSLGLVGYSDDDSDSETSGD